jgi:hypothetical protein
MFGYNWEFLVTNWEKVLLFCVRNGAEFPTPTTGWKSPQALKEHIFVFATNAKIWELGSPECVQRLYGYTKLAFVQFNENSQNCV